MTEVSVIPLISSSKLENCTPIVWNTLHVHWNHFINRIRQHWFVMSTPFAVRMDNAFDISDLTTIRFYSMIPKSRCMVLHNYAIRRLVNDSVLLVWRGFLVQEQNLCSLSYWLTIKKSINQDICFCNSLSIPYLQNVCVALFFYLINCPVLFQNKVNCHIKRAR